ncbi:MAG: o-succinylbenzoate--CoA ligase [Pseudomonadota bacterium]
MPYTGNISYWVERNSAIFPAKTAVIDDRRRLTYKQLQERVSGLAAGLRASGVKKGDRVACLLYNCGEMVELCFACARLGALFVPLNWRLGEEELVFILRDCTPAVLVYDGPWEEKVKGIAGQADSMRLVKTGGDYEDMLAGSEETASHEPETGGDDDLLIIYTSGTTGLPKGVVLTHDNVFWQTINGWSLGVSPDTVCLVLLPLFHVGGLNSSVTPMLHVGATVILHRAFDAKKVLAAVEEEKVTGIVAVPAIYQFLSEQPEFQTRDLSSLEVLISGGAPLPHHLIELYHGKGFELRQGYGLTEASPGVTGMGPGECLAKAGTVGRQLPYTEVRIADGDGRALAAGVEGEILVKGPNVMKGYWKREQETAQALEGGWLHTGDIGVMDGDGFVSIVGREKDMIISGGENIYPAEIEKILAGHPDVEMAAVVGRSDEKWGEVPVAVVVPRKEGLDPAALLRLLEGKLARYKIPKDFLFVKELPVNAAGKVIKPEVKKKLGIT